MWTSTRGGGGLAHVDACGQGGQKSDFVVDVIFCFPLFDNDAFMRQALHVLDAFVLLLLLFLKILLRYTKPTCISSFLSGPGNRTAVTQDSQEISSSYIQGSTAVTQRLL